MIALCMYRNGAHAAVQRCGSVTSPNDDVGCNFSCVPTVFKAVFFIIKLKLK